MCIASWVLGAIIRIYVASTCIDADWCNLGDDAFSIYQQMNPIVNVFVFIGRHREVRAGIVFEIFVIVKNS
jgi:hypothetical protein